MPGAHTARKLLLFLLNSGFLTEIFFSHSKLLGSIFN